MTLSTKARAISGNVPRDVVPAKKTACTVGPAGRLRDRDDDHRQEHGRAEQGDRDPAGSLGLEAQPAEQARAARPTSRSGRRSPSLATAGRAASFPFERSVPIALFTHVTQRVPLLEARARSARRPASRGTGRATLRVRDLHGRHVERGRQVDHEAVDLLVLQAPGRPAFDGKTRRLLRGLDLVLDQLVARRAELRAELVAASVRRSARDLRDRRPVVARRPTGDVVVRVAEVDDLRRGPA